MTSHKTTAGKLILSLAFKENCNEVVFLFQPLRIFSLSYLWLSRSPSGRASLSTGSTLQQRRGNSINTINQSTKVLSLIILLRHVWKGCSLFPNPMVNFDWHINPGGVSHLGSRVARVLRSLSPDSLANLVANVVPGQDIHRIGSGGSISFVFSIIAMSNIQKYTSLDHFGCLQL